MGAPDTRDPRTQAFDWVITELWYWINNDYAVRNVSKSEVRAVEDTWMEIAQKIEQWRDEQHASATAGDAGGDG